MECKAKPVTIFTKWSETSRYFLLSNAIGVDKNLPIKLGELSENNPDKIYPSRDDVIVYRSGSLMMLLRSLRLLNCGYCKTFKLIPSQLQIWISYAKWY